MSDLQSSNILHWYTQLLFIKDLQWPILYRQFAICQTISTNREHKMTSSKWSPEETLSNTIMGKRVGCYSTIKG
jgi:hypothetical protein